MGLRRKRCGSEGHVRNGFMKGLQRYRCKACGLNFTDTPPRGMPLRVKVTAVLLYLSGLSVNRTAKLLGVSTPSVMTWIEQGSKISKSPCSFLANHVPSVGSSFSDSMITVMH